MPLLLDEGGYRMAKRRCSLTLHELRNAGARPERVVGLLAWSLGLVPILQALSAQELLAQLDINQTGFTNAPLDTESIAWLLP